MTSEKLTWVNDHPLFGRFTLFTPKVQVSVCLKMKEEDKIFDLIRGCNRLYCTKQACFKLKSYPFFRGLTDLQEIFRIKNWFSKTNRKINAEFCLGKLFVLSLLPFVTEFSEKCNFLPFNQKVSGKYYITYNMYKYILRKNKGISPK